MSAITLPAALAASLRMQAPQPLLADPDTLRLELPAAMQTAKRWLLWRLESGNKVPYYASFIKRHGVLDTPKDRENLVGLDQALKAIDRRPGFNLGFALGPDGSGQYWQGIDLDHAENHPGHAELLEMMPGYRERSPSGKGYHAMGYGRDFPALASNRTGIEAYSAGRYFTVTGWAIGGEVADLAPFVVGTLAPLHRAGDPTLKASVADKAIIRVTDTQVTELRSALNSISPDDRETWIAMGQALAELGSVGRGLWLDWSQMSDKWQPRDADNWATFRGDHTGYQAVFSRAQQGGWVNPARKAKAPHDGHAAIVDGATQVPLQEGTQGLELEHDAGQEEGQAKRQLTPVSLAHFASATYEPTKFVIDPLIPMNALSLVGGHGEIGKGLLTLALAVHVVAGQPWAGLPVQQGKVLYLSLEDPPEVILYRLRRICDVYGLDAQAVADGLTVLDGTEADALAQEVNVGGIKSIQPTTAMLEFAEALPGHALAIIDNVSDGFDGDENSRRQVRVFLKMLARLAREHGVAILALAHVDKTAARYGANGNTYSGSTAWHNTPRSRLALTKGEDDAITLTHEKLNLGKKLPEPISLSFQEGVLVPMDGQQREVTKELMDGIHEQSILTVVRAAVEADRHIPVATQGAHTAWGALKVLPDFPANMTKATLDAGMARLQKQGKIRIERYRKNCKDTSRWTTT